MMMMMRGRRGLSRPDKGRAGRVGCTRAWFRVTNHQHPQLLLGAEDAADRTRGAAEWSLYVLGNPMGLLVSQDAVHGG